MQKVKHCPSHMAFTVNHHHARFRESYFESASRPLLTLLLETQPCPFTLLNTQRLLFLRRLCVLFKRQKGKKKKNQESRLT